MLISQIETIENMKQNKGRIIIISSPSGGGKSTIAKMLIKQCKNIVPSISMTTREKGRGEINGVDYYFISNEDFQDHIKNDQLLEYAPIYRHYYGTPKDFVYHELNQGKDVIFDIDWQGHQSIRKLVKNYQIISFFIMPPSIDILKERLINRDREDLSNIEHRLAEASADMSHKDEFDFIIINQVLEDAVGDILTTLGK